ncbi:MAG: histidine phosphatase family protein [Saccharospirillum sp.]|nr:histidine phosphatase family protein [Saccharospirillum sp.]
MRDALLSLDPDHSHWVITSGGVISALIGQALELNANSVIKLNLALNNASVTEVSIKGDRIRLNSFNQVQHFYGKDIFLSYF